MLDRAKMGVRFAFNAEASFPSFVLSTPSGDEVECQQRGLSHCIFNAESGALSLAISDNNSDIGERFVLSFLPIDPSDTVRPAPYQQNLVLDQSALPYRGTVSDWYSNYTITGLMPDQYYLSSIRERIETLSFAAWPNTAAGILCNLTLTGLAANGCLTQAGSDGKIRIRVGGDSGGQFAIDVQQASVLQNDYQSQDTPLPIADDSVIGTTSAINVTQAGTVGFAEVYVQVQHGYTSDLTLRLQAPDGRMIALAEHVPGTSFGNTVFSDLADSPGPTEYASHVLQRYRPAEPLHVLHGSNAAGTWQLHVTDDTYSNRTDALGGMLLMWGLGFVQQP